MRRSKSTGRIAKDDGQDYELGCYGCEKSRIQCRMYCNGRKCKYCIYKEDDETAIKGLYSTWISDSILAMARPSTVHFQNGLVESFKKEKIVSVINLQERGEHSFCGQSLLPSGFTYDPEQFMKNEIFFYNFPMADFRTCTVEFLLDILKVMHFSIEQGKVAIHCHAGHGRTGMLIAAFMIYWEGMRPKEAVEYVRNRRSNSVQSAEQVGILNDLYSLLSRDASFLYGCGPSCSVCDSPRSFPYPSPFATHTASPNPFEDQKESNSPSYDQILRQEKSYLSGVERRVYKKVPKAIVVLVSTFLRRIFSTSRLVINGKDLNDRRLFWSVGSPIPSQESPLSCLSQVFDASSHGCSACEYLKQLGDKLLTISNCSSLLQNANAYTLLTLLDNRLSFVKHPSQHELSSFLSVNVALSQLLGAQLEESWEWTFLVVARAFSLLDESSLPFLAHLLYRFFTPPDAEDHQRNEEMCLLLLQRSRETRAFWEDGLTKGRAGMLVQMECKDEQDGER